MNSYSIHNNNNNDNNHSEHKEFSDVSNKEQELREKIIKLRDDLNTEISALDIKALEKLDKEESDKSLTSKKLIKIEKRNFLQSIIDSDQNTPAGQLINENISSESTYPINQKNSLGQIIKEKFDALDEKKRAEIFKGTKSRVEKLITPILSDYEKFLKAQEDLTKEMDALRKKLKDEESEIQRNIESAIESGKRNSDLTKLKAEKSKKEIKSNFLTNVLYDHRINVNKAVKDSVEGSLWPIHFTDRELIIGGTFSRVGSLMKKVLGDSNTVKTFFQMPKVEKVDLKATNSMGDQLYRAEIHNLIADLNDEIHSFFPTPNKERKIFKRNFLAKLLDDYDIKAMAMQSNNIIPSLKTCYIEAYCKLTDVEKEVLKAGRDSRVDKLLHDLQTDQINQSDQSIIHAL